jgi:nitroreductase
MIAELIKRNRSCRRFYQEQRVDMKTLESLVDLARVSGSAANRQPLKYILSQDPEKNRDIFSCVAWAAYLKDWPGPEDGERPSAYIVILGDTSIVKDFWCDHGIASQSILLGAREIGLAGCMIGAINKKRLIELLDIAPHFEILLILAIGKPREEVVIEAVGPDGDIRYWRDDRLIHHVPKRRLEDIIIKTY